MRSTRALQDRLNATFDRIGLLDPTEIELRADFARYLCVLVAGYLEEWARTATAEFTRRRSDVAVTNFVVRASSRLTNLNATKLKNHFFLFNASGQAELDALLVDEAKDAVDSVLAVRHLIAHGQAGDITIERVTRYFREVKRVVDSIETIIGIGA